MHSSNSSDFSTINWKVLHYTVPLRTLFYTVYRSQTTARPFKSIKSNPYATSGKSSRMGFYLSYFQCKIVCKRFRDKQCKWFKSLTFANSIITKYSGTYSEHWLLLEHLSSEPLTAIQLKTMTRQDKILPRVLYFVQNGWPATVEPTLTPYTSRKYELCLLNGCVLWSTRVVVPTAGCKRILDYLHETHQGASLMKARAWMIVWWPGLDKSVEEMVSN